MAKFKMTTREELLATYEQIVDTQPVTFKTLPYYSTALVEFEVVNADETHAFAYAVARAQQLDFFDYGIGTRIQYGGDQNHKATRVETNISRANSTNGAFDFVIEEIGLHCRSPRQESISPTDTAYTGSFVLAGQTADIDVFKALAGLGDIYDPTALVTPQQLASPFFTGNVLWEAVKNQMAMAITFDGQNYRELGVAANFALGAEAHPWHNDSPPPDDLALQIEEGLLWAKDGESDSDMTFRGQIMKPIVVPISGVVPPGTAAGVILPNKIWLPIVATFHGLEIGIPSSNG
jgi:hypothetical protein